MKYIVKVNYTNYTFDDRSTAMTFAEVAAEHIEPKDYQDRDVTITVISGDGEGVE